MTQVHEPETKKTLLWSLLRPDCKESYLFGTMHVRDAVAFSYFEAVKPYISKCEVYAAELDLDQAEQKGLIGDAFLPNDLTLLDYISARKYLKLERMIKKAFQIELNHFIRLYPLFVINMIAESILSKDYHVALDHAMWQFAENAGKHMKGVESYDDQMNTLKRLPVSSQVKQLVKIGKDPSKIRKSTSKVVQYYRRMDIQKLYQYSKKGMGDMRKSLIYTRNKKMTKTIEQLVLVGSTFIAVGAGHLSGGSGLIRLLKQRNFKLVPIQIKKSDLDNL